VCAFLSVAVSHALAASPFSPTGIWNKPLPASPDIDPNSLLMVTTLASDIANQARGPRPDYPYLSQASYSTPVYYVDADTPKQQVVIDNRSTKNRLLQEKIDEDGGVPIPEGARAAAGRDGHITIVDTDRRVFYEFWRASSPEQNALDCLRPLPWHRPPFTLAFCHRDGRWHALTGGIMKDYDVNPGFFSNAAWPDLEDHQGWTWGATATSLPFLGGLITLEDLRSGVIDHAVAGSLPEACRNVFMYPAQREDGVRIGPGCMPEGARLQLDPAYDVEADDNPPLTKMVERAAQRYGIIIRDVTHDNFGFEGQDPLTEPEDPYRTGPGVGGIDNGNKGFFGGKRPSELFRNFPWHRLRVIAARRCRAAPCLP
jgi:hypothetical protein